MNPLQTRWLIVLIVLTALAALSWCVVRDINLTEQYPGDLRNRVIGARMQMEGKSPYFYHWNTGDSDRYYDWNNNSPDALISNVTATPFFHQLISPIANFPQKTIAWIWLVFAYVSHAIIMYCSYKIAVTRIQKLSTLLIGFMFLFTSAWTETIYNGQMYFIIALFAMLFFTAVRNNRSVPAAFLAGVLGMSLILIKFTFVLYLLPFLLLASQYNRRYKFTLIAGVFVTLATAFAGEHKLEYWHDYSAAVKDHIKVHQGLQPATRDNFILPLHPAIDGWQRKDIALAQDRGFYKNQEANSNVFVFINILSGRRIPVTLLSALLILCLGVLSVLYFKKFPFRAPHGLFPVAIFGFLLHMTTDLFSPVHRFHYYAAQWAFPLLLAACYRNQSFSPVLMIGVLIGMFLNGLPASLFPMQHTIGEYVIYASLLGLLLTYKNRKA